ncbi:MAG: family ATPase [Aeromicrobium sp.]|nr:family ATPase [Aeromicrobium sp.]
MLAADDDLPADPRRVLVAGTSGAGKTTLTQQLSERLDLPRTELDALFHGPGWTPRPGFLDDVRELAAGDAWVTEWQYPDARPILADRADLLVWLDLPFRVTLRRISRRTVVRRARRTELWHGNREPPLHTVLTDTEHVIRWAIRGRHVLRDAVPALGRTHPDLTVVRLSTPREVERWLARL